MLTQREQIIALAATGIEYLLGINFDEREALKHTPRNLAPQKLRLRHTLGTGKQTANLRQRNRRTDALRFLGRR